MARLSDFVSRNSKLIQVLALVTVVALVFALGSHLVVYADDKKTLAIGIVVLLVPLLLYMAVARPFVFPVSLYVLLVPFDNLLSLDPRYGTLTKLVAICAGMALVFSLIRHRRYIPLPRVALLWLGLLMWMSLTVFWALDSVQAITKLLTYTELILLYLVISITPLTMADFKIFSTAVVLGATFASLYAIHLFHSGVGVQTAEIAQQLTSRVFVRVGDSHIDPNAFAAALLLPISLVMMLILQRKWSLTKLSLLGLLMVLLGGAYVSASRGAMLAIGVMMVYLLIRSRFKAQVLFFSIVGLSAALILTNPFARFGDAIRTGGAGRLSIWKVGLDAFRHHWLVGAGVGNFPFAYDKSFIAIYQTYNAGWHRASHDLIILMAVELGIVGLALGLIAWYQQWRMLSYIQKTDQFYNLRVAFESAIVGLFVASLFLQNLEDKYIWLAFSLMSAARTLTLTMARPAQATLSDVHLVEMRNVATIPPLEQKVLNRA